MTGPERTLTKVITYINTQSRNLNLAGCFKAEGTSVVRKCLKTVQTRSPRKKMGRPSSGTSNRRAAMV